MHGQPAAMTDITCKWQIHLNATVQHTHVHSAWMTLLFLCWGFKARIVARKASDKRFAAGERFSVCLRGAIACKRKNKRRIYMNAFGPTWCLGGGGRRAYMSRGFFLDYFPLVVLALWRAPLCVCQRHVIMSQCCGSARCCAVCGRRRATSGLSEESEWALLISDRHHGGYWRSERWAPVLGF